MSGEVILFVVFALIAIAAAVMVVASPSPVHSALWLILNLVSIAALYLSLNATFLMAVQLIVYAGAIVVLFLFVVMVLSARREDTVQSRLPWLRSVGFGAAVLFFAAFVWMLKVESGGGQEALLPGGPAEVGRVLYTKYLLPFEATSILLLAALVGALYLGRRQKQPEPEDSTWEETDREVATL